MSSGRPSKNERREAARETARRLREEQERKRKRNRLFLQGGVILGVLAIVAIVAVVVTTTVKANAPGPGPKNMADDSATVVAGDHLVSTPANADGGKPKGPVDDSTSGHLVIRAYEDFMCPYCGNFEKANRDYIASLVKSGKAIYKIYPVSILDRESNGTKYSTRAANAAAAVANASPDHFFEFHRLLYANQPEEGSDGLSNATLIKYAKQAGVSGAALTRVTNDINGGTYSGWVTAATNRFLAGDLPQSDAKTVTGTPVVLVNGKQYAGAATGTLGQFQAFIAQTTGKVAPSA